MQLGEMKLHRYAAASRVKKLVGQEVAFFTDIAHFWQNSDRQLHISDREDNGCAKFQFWLWFFQDGSFTAFCIFGAHFLTKNFPITFLQLKIWGFSASKQNAVNQRLSQWHIIRKLGNLGYIFTQLTCTCVMMFLPWYLWMLWWICNSFCQWCIIMLRPWNYSEFKFILVNIFKVKKSEVKIPAGRRNISRPMPDVLRLGLITV